MLHRLYKQKLKVRIHSVGKVLDEGLKAKQRLAQENPKGIRCCEDENHHGGCACCTDECCECECLGKLGIPLPKCVTVHGVTQGSVAKMLFVSADNRTLMRERRLQAQVSACGIIATAGMQMMSNFTPNICEGNWAQAEESQRLRETLQSRQDSSATVCAVRTDFIL